MPELTVIPDWKSILRHAWSVRLMILAALLSGLEVALPLVNGLLPIRLRADRRLGARPALEAGCH